jgi:hypothetical protein
MNAVSLTSNNCIYSKVKPILSKDHSTILKKRPKTTEKKRKFLDKENPRYYLQEIGSNLNGNDPQL